MKSFRQSGLSQICRAGYGATYDIKMNYKWSSELVTVHLQNGLSIVPSSSWTRLNSLSPSFVEHRTFIIIIHRRQWLPTWF